MNNNNLDIYIITHTDFVSPVNNPVYKIAYVNEISTEKYNLECVKCDKVDLPQNDLFYSELWQYKYICDNVPLKKYVGFCHYRKYWSFFDNIPDIDKIFENCDIIVGRPLAFACSVQKQYSACHNVEDLNIVSNIVKEMFPEYAEDMEHVWNSNVFFQCNMFIMKSEDFKNYCHFIFTILNEYCNRVGNIEKWISEHYIAYYKHFNAITDKTHYNYRIGGYLAERLTNVYIEHNYKRLKLYDIVITGDRQEKFVPFEDVDKEINVGIVNYNTPELIQACVRSLLKFNPKARIYVFDNSDKYPCTQFEQENVTVFDNTRQQIVCWDDMLKKHPLSVKSCATQNNFATLKHCMSVDALMKLIGQPFVLLDSDVLVKSSLLGIYREKDALVGTLHPESMYWKARLYPFLCFINTPMLHMNGISFFDENRMCGLWQKYTVPDFYDTGAVVLEDCINKKLPVCIVDMNQYIEHYGSASWNFKQNKITIKQWLEKFEGLWKK